MFGKLKQSIFGASRTGASTLEFAEPPALVLVRKARQSGDNWFGAKSYLGGLPKLGTTPWPRDAAGKPLYFMAQLDLAEIDRSSAGRSVLPKTGALAFFIGGPKYGCILHVREPGATFTPAPAGRVPPRDVGGSELVDPAFRHGPQEFPFWAVEFHALSTGPAYIPGDPDTFEMAHDAQYADIKSRFGERKYSFSLQAACEKAGLDDLPLYGLAALMFAERVPRMVDAVASARQRGASDLEKATARLSALEAGQPAPAGQGRFGDPEKEKANAESWINIGRKTLANAEANAGAVAAYVERVREAMPDIDPFRPVTGDEAAKLDALLGEACKPPLADYARYLLPRSWRDYAGDAVRLMACGPEEGFSRLPKPLRNVIFQSYRLPIRSSHLMFGIGDNVQDNPNFEIPEQRLVLQLTFDDMVDWSFGDNGVHQFWMPVTALKAGDFSKAEATFECH